MIRYTRRQRLILGLALPFGITIVAVNFASALGASESTKDDIILVGGIAFIIAIIWVIWNMVRKPKG